MDTREKIGVFGAARFTGAGVLERYANLVLLTPLNSRLINPLLLRNLQFDFFRHADKRGKCQPCTGVGKIANNAIHRHPAIVIQDDPSQKSANPLGGFGWLGLSVTVVMVL